VIGQCRAPAECESEWVIFARVIEKIFKFRGEAWAFSSTSKERMQETFGLLVCLRVNPSASVLVKHMT